MGQTFAEGMWTAMAAPAQMLGQQSARYCRCCGAYSKRRHRYALPLMRRLWIRSDAVGLFCCRQPQVGGGWPMQHGKLCRFSFIWRGCKDCSGQSGRVVQLPLPFDLPCLSVLLPLSPRLHLPNSGWPSWCWMIRRRLRGCRCAPWRNWRG